jgi:serine/threonine-protein kinase
MVVNVTKTDPPDPLIGQRVGDSYRITELLGSGGMGTVYLAESAAFGGLKIAVKVLTAKASDAVARFVREAYTAGRVNDQFSVVGLVDTGVLQTGQHYIALQYCDGGSLQALLAERGGKPLPFDDILSFISPVCAALAHAHAANLVHRDIKPANILFMRDGTVLRARVGDFGIAKLREYSHLVLTAPKSIMGTPGYMSPEQWMDTSGADSRSDIYSIGCVLYELVTRRLPYLGTQNELMQQTKRNAPIPPPIALRPDTPPMWNNAIMRCLAHRREDRIQTVLELIHILEAAIENGTATVGFFAPSLVTIATAPTANTLSQSGGAAQTLWSQAQPAIQRKSSTSASGRRSWRMLMAGIAIGTVTTGAVALTTRSASPEADTPHIALAEHKAASTAPVPAEPEAVPFAPKAHEAARTAPEAHGAAQAARAPTLPGDATVASTMVSELTAAATTAHVDAAPKNAAHVGAAPKDAAIAATAPELATPAAHSSSDGTRAKQLASTKPSPTTPPSLEQPTSRTTTPTTTPTPPPSSQPPSRTTTPTSVARSSEPTKQLAPTKPSPTTAPSEPPPSRTTPAETPPTTPTSKPRDAQSSVVATGELVVSVDPYAEVWLDNKSVGPTPLSIRVRVGQHRLRLVNKDLAIEKSIPVTVSADKPARVEESWR